MSTVKEQPVPATVMDSAKRPVEHEDLCSEARLAHSSCHYTRLRRTILPAIFLLFTAAALLILEFGDLDLGIGGTGGLLRRNTTGNNSSFVKNKLYLIIVLVGLVLVLLMGIALSFCCCKASFENPCCCPCYLCACCGGLACLECISCGLCAEGIADLNV